MTSQNIPCFLEMQASLALNQHESFKLASTKEMQSTLQAKHSNTGLHKTKALVTSYKAKFH